MFLSNRASQCLVIKSGRAQGQCAVCAVVSDTNMGTRAVAAT